MPPAECFSPSPGSVPESWVTAAVERWRELLVDHANCEKKAASTAVALMFAYPEDHGLALALSRLAREELAKLVWEVRKKLEPFGAAQLIENERSRGYRLQTCPASPAQAPEKPATPRGPRHVKAP